MDDSQSVSLFVTIGDRDQKCCREVPSTTTDTVGQVPVCRQITPLVQDMVQPDPGFGSIKKDTDAVIVCTYIYKYIYIDTYTYMDIYPYIFTITVSVSFIYIYMSVCTYMCIYI